MPVTLSALPAVNLFDYVAGWADSGQERGAALTFTLVKLSRVSQGLRLRLSGVYSVSFSLAASTEAPRFWFSFFSESQYRMPWLLEDGLSPFYNARVAWHIPSPGQAVESTVEVERERVTRRDHIVCVIVCSISSD